MKPATYKGVTYNVPSWAKCSLKPAKTPYVVLCLAEGIMETK